jgi:hypothetical protein
MGTVIGGSPGICTTVIPTSGGTPGKSGGRSTGGGGGAGAIPLLVLIVMIDPGKV